MKHVFVFLLFVISAANGSAQVKVEDFRSKPGLSSDWHVIQAALCYVDSLGHGTLEFEGTRTYKINRSLELPRYSKRGSRILILNGNGCRIEAKKDTISVFRRIPKDQNEALNKMMSTRIHLNDFVISGGRKAIDLGATYSSSINRCMFENQKAAAVDIQFGLQTEINHCQVINNHNDGFVIRTGEEWGGSANNSQSNHTVLRSCRVYARKNGNGASVRILGSSGVVIDDFISEGGNNEYAVYVDVQRSTTVRMLTLRNLHIEHIPEKCGIYLRSTGISKIDGIFYQLARPDWPLIYVPGGIQQVVLSNIPHFVTGTILKHDTDAAWELDNVHEKFLNPENWRSRNREGNYVKKPPFFSKGEGYLYQQKQKL